MNFSMEQITNYAVEYGPKVLAALAVLIIGLWIIGFIIRILDRLMERQKVDATLRPFLKTMASLLLKVLLFISVASMLGIATTSFVAVLGAATLAVGFALQGSLGNFAGGVLLLIFRPFKVGDLIEAQDAFGFVKEISVFVTKVQTFQNKMVIVPNGPLAGGNITNYSSVGNVRADIPFAVRYESNVDEAKKIVLDILQNSEHVLKDPAPSVYVSELGENNVKLMALPYCTVDDYWDVFWGLQDDIKKALGAAGFNAPFPQRVIHYANGQERS